MHPANHPNGLQDHLARLRRVAASHQHRPWYGMRPHRTATAARGESGPSNAEEDPPRQLAGAFRNHAQQRQPCVRLEIGEVGARGEIRLARPGADDDAEAGHAVRRERFRVECQQVQAAQPGGGHQQHRRRQPCRRRRATCHPALSRWTSAPPAPSTSTRSRLAEPLGVLHDVRHADLTDAGPARGRGRASGSG